MEQIRRCEWAGPDQIYIDYHDNEWGQPRLNTIRHANQIFVVAEGQIAQRGVHEALMREEGVYRKCVSVREGGPEEEGDLQGGGTGQR